jgi:hypothetical protein
MPISELSIPTYERDTSSSGVAWGAVLGGAFVTAALSLLLLALGAGFELSAISPWSNVGASASTAGTGAVVWLIVTQLIACAMGGYLTGRLRTKWHVIHRDEVHFRDTANGFLAWAVAVVVTVAFLASAATAMVGGTVTAHEASREATAANGAEQSGDVAYFVDRLFESDHPGALDNDIAVRAQVGRLFSRILRRPDDSATDSSYLGLLVAAKTGLNPADAGKRVSETIGEAQRTEDTLRKATARLLLSIFFALLIGAFCSSYAATIGGKQRDHVQVI